jgi:hypothetical protein
MVHATTWRRLFSNFWNSGSERLGAQHVIELRHTISGAPAVSDTAVS